MRRWQLQEAKARFSEVVKSSQTGPQEITVHGEPAAVVLSRRDYDHLRGGTPTFLEFLRHSPLVGLELALERDGSPLRELDL